MNLLNYSTRRLHILYFGCVAMLALYATPAHTRSSCRHLMIAIGTELRRREVAA